MRDLTWQTIGKTSDLIAGAGVGAQIGHQQIALFWLKPHQRLYAVSNFCPFSEANIIARGIIGDIDGEPVVASPLHKEHFSLLDGRCLEHPEQNLAVWQAQIVGDEVQIAC